LPCGREDHKKGDGQIDHIDENQGMYAFVHLILFEG
jgi:hypothetical protein